MKKVIILYFLLVSSVVANEFSITLENDLFYHTDRHYTHGTRLTYYKDDVPKWVDNLFPNNYNKISYTLAQHMYTPSDIEKKEYIPDDRPYGGWLYVGFGIASRFYDRLDTFETDIGFTGPLSFAEDTQKCIHRMVGATKPEGWQFQIKTEPGINISYERKYRFRHEGLIDADFIPYAGTCLGNIFTIANLGILGRIGYNIPNDFGYTKMEPNPREMKWLSLYLFGSIEGRYVLRNIFLDGNTFVDSPSVDKETMVADFVYGVGSGIGKFNLIFANTYRTKEFTLQKDDNEFGTLIMYWKF